MTAVPLEPSNSQSYLLPLAPNLKPEKLLLNLRMNALLAHQHSVGRGDDLVLILKNTIAQMERTHSRVQVMSTTLFLAGLLLLGVATYAIVFGGRGADLWTALLGGAGGLTALAATFWTAPLDKMSDSVSDLVKLEAAFLGYIRVIGELDSAFQMQYLDILHGSKDFRMDQVTIDTTNQMKDIMTHTMRLIDQYVVGEGHALSELKTRSDELDERLKLVEAAARSGG